MIVVDTTILVYAVGAEHRFSDPSRRLVEAVGTGRVRATTTIEAIQEFVHVRARRQGRAEAATSGRAYATLLSPLLAVDERDLESGLALFQRVPELGAFDAVLVAAAIAREAEAFVSADAAFARVPGLRWIEPGTAAFESLISS